MERHDVGKYGCHLPLDPLKIPRAAAVLLFDEVF
jgi:hypothetical protein